jgi:hypothetical protein
MAAGNPRDLVDEAVQQLIAKDSFLLETNAAERAIAARLAVYLEEHFLRHHVNRHFGIASLLNRGRNEAIQDSSFPQVRPTPQNRLQRPKKTQTRLQTTAIFGVQVSADVPSGCCSMRIRVCLGSSHSIDHWRHASRS